MTTGPYSPTTISIPLACKCLEESITRDIDNITHRPDGATTLVTNYDYNDQLLLRITDPNGDSTTFVYDDFQRLSEIRNADNIIVSLLSYSYSRIAPADTFDTTKPNFVREKLVRGNGDTTITRAYFDGLGRQISTQMRDGDDDIVLYNTYDALGRPDSSFKAFRHDTDHDFLQRSDFPASPLFELIEYEANPLNRVSKVTPFGGGSDISFIYGTELFDGKRYRFVQSTDEIGVKTKEYFDKFDNRVSIKNAETTGDETTTEFLYDILDNLTTSRPPNYFDPPGTSSDSDWITTFQYNTLSQLTKKLSPDAGTSQFKYDHNGNLRFSQDANQDKSGKVLFVTYDGLNRPLASGEAVTTFANLDGDNSESFESVSSNWITLNVYDTTAPPNAYPWNLFDFSGITLSNTKNRLAASAHLTHGNIVQDTLILEDRNFSDPEPQTFRGLNTVIAGNDTIASTADVVFKAGNLIHLKPGFKTVAGSTFGAMINPALSDLVDHWQVTLFSYDDNGRLENKYIFTKGLTDSTKFIYTYDRQGNITQVKTVQGSEEVYHWYDYNERGLLEKVFVSQDTTKPSTADYAFAYTATGLPDSTVFIKTLKYQYNDRDWLTDINDVNSTAEPFAAKYDYFDDGNVKTAVFFNDSSGISAEKKFKYDFMYDKRKQILSGNYSFDISGSWQSTSRFDVNDITYDDNGNILTLKRNDEQGDESDMDYDYNNNNRLQSLESGEAENPIQTNYTYDNNGNVISVEEDEVDKFRTIHYENRNLPVFIELADFTDVLYLYNVDGQRVFNKVDNQAGEHYIMVVSIECREGVNNG